jgi:hypothetical protein
MLLLGSVKVAKKCEPAGTAGNKPPWPLGTEMVVVEELIDAASVAEALLENRTGIAAPYKDDVIIPQGDRF